MKLFSLNIVHVMVLSVIFTCFHYVHASKVRHKRVLYGRPAERGERDIIPSFRYFVSITNDVPGIIKRFFRDYAPNLRDLVCGGSLITPTIIQTAAHCVGEVWWIEGIPKWPIRVKSLFEELLYVYIGHNTVSQMKYYLKPQRYYVDTSIATALAVGGPWIGDMGYIITKERVIDAHPTAKISYAPSYPIQQIYDFFDEALTNEYTCLHIGHGLYSVAEDREVGLHIETKKSNRIRWGWRTLMSPIDCEVATFPLNARHIIEESGIENFTYSEIATWSCSQSVKHLLRTDDFVYHTGPGDSGGPYTCNNVYFGVVSGGSTGGADDIITYDTAIAYYIFENGAEDRGDFLSFMDSVAYPTEYYPAHTTPRGELRGTSSPPKSVARFLLLPLFVFYIYRHY